MLRLVVGGRWSAVLLTAFLVAGCTSGPGAPVDDSSYVNELTTERENKDRQFRASPGEPVPADKLATMLPLQYYPADPNLAIPAVLQLSEQRPAFEMPTSTGTLRRYQLVGTLEFTYQGQPHSLGAFVPAGEPIQSLFVPFADQTTGSETYPAGRYLDVHPTATGFYTIDFNRAYNPYCAYNASYECPFPPPSNRLKIPVRAGEKNPGV
jgi:uncharacterized protein (DUF1684 family)